MPDWLTWGEHFIQTVGFPIFVACFLLWREAVQGKRMTETLEELKKAIDALVVRLEKDDS